MAKIEYKVCVVTVTYGDRWKFLEQVLKRVLSFESVSNVVIVNNASSYSVSDSLESLGDERLILIDKTENLGSAGGYKEGLENASNLAADLIWLLDDDNLPEEGCLNNLLQKWDVIEPSNNQKALYCLRTDRVQQVKIAQGEDPYRFYLVPDNFLGFNAFKILTNQFKKQIDKYKKRNPLKDATIPFTPYGGLIIHTSTIKKIGLPKEEFYLYVDDTEYTYRITESGQNIWLVPTCKITDIDKSQGVGYKNKIFRSVLLDEWSFRTYYHVRNMIFFNKKAIENNYVFKLNKNLYLTGLYLTSILSSKRSEYKQLLIAINDGLNGHLGKRF